MKALAKARVREMKVLMSKVAAAREDARPSSAAPAKGTVVVDVTPRSMAT
jgi:hypothetical protein